MSVLRRAWDLRSVSTFGGLPERGRSRPLPDGYGQRGAGKWLDGMSWQSWGGPAGADSAMRLSAVFACLRLLSEAVSTLPLDTFHREGGARRPFRPRPTYLDFRAPQVSRIDYLSQVMLSLLTDGNAFVLTPRDGMGVTSNLHVLDPSMVTIRPAGGRAEYVVSGAPEPLGPGEIMHIKGMTLPGQLRGVSPLEAARDVVDGGRKAQDFGTSFMANNAMPPGVIEMPDDPIGNGRERARAVAEAWNESHGGTANAGKVGVLLGGASLKTIAIKPTDAEWLDSKRFGVSEIARFYGVPPHLIADASNSTSWGSGLAEQNLAFGQFSLRPWIERIEDAHNRLLVSDGLAKAFIKLNLDALLRASLADRYASYAIGIGNRFLHPNEARRFEDLEPLPDGDQWPDSPEVSHEP